MGIQYCCIYALLVSILSCSWCPLAHCNRSLVLCPYLAYKSNNVAMASVAFSLMAFWALQSLSIRRSKLLSLCNISLSISILVMPPIGVLNASLMPVFSQILSVTGGQSVSFNFILEIDFVLLEEDSYRCPNEFFSHRWEASHLSETFYLIPVRASPVTHTSGSWICCVK